MAQEPSEQQQIQWLAEDVKRREHRQRTPQRVGQVVSRLMARRGYGAEKAAALSQQAWQAAVGQALAMHSRPGRSCGGVLEVIVANSMIMQELTFQKQAILEQLKQQLPEMKWHDLRFRVGQLQ